MNIKRYVFIAISAFLVVVVLAISISAKFSLSNITADPYVFIENFFNQWSPALSAAGTLIVAVLAFRAIYERQRVEERQKRQKIHALHHEMQINLCDIQVVLKSIARQLNDKGQIPSELLTQKPNTLFYQPLDVTVFDSIKTEGQLNWFGDLSTDIVAVYRISRQYNQDKYLRSYHYDSLKVVHEATRKAIKNLEKRFAFLPHLLAEPLPDKMVNGQQEEADKGSTSIETT